MKYIILRIQKACKSTLKIEYHLHNYATDPSYIQNNDLLALYLERHNILA